MADELNMSEVEFHGSVALVRLAGRFEANGAQRLMQRCGEIRENGCCRLVIDLSAVTFVASSAIGTLLVLREEFAALGGGLRLAALSQAVEAVLDLLNLISYVDIHETDVEAMAAFAKLPVSGRPKTGFDRR